MAVLSSACTRHCRQAPAAESAGAVQASGALFDAVRFISPSLIAHSTEESLRLFSAQRIQFALVLPGFT